MSAALPGRHLLLVLVICLAWAGNFLASAIALQDTPPFLFTALRLALVLALLFPFLRRPAAGHWPRLIAVAALNGSVHFGLSFWALRVASDLSSIAIAMQTYVPMSVLLSVWLLGERVGWRRGLAIGISFAGVLFMGLDPEVADRPFALVLCLVSAFSLALGSVLMRGLEGVGPFSMQAWAALVGVPLMLAVSLALEGAALATLPTLPLSAWAGVAYSAVAASIVGHGLYFGLVRHHGVSAVTPYLLLVPVFATILGVLFWGDRPGWRLLTGGTLVLGGVLVVILRARVRRVPAPLPPSA